MVERILRGYLYATAGILLLALPCAALPYEWMDSVHRWLGMGRMPDEPIVRYLARSASALYASIGVLYAFLAADIPRYRDVLRLLGWVKVGLGCLLVPIDMSAEMPWFWTAYEGPFVAGWGTALLVMLKSLPGPEASLQSSRVEATQTSS